MAAVVAPLKPARANTLFAALRINSRFACRIWPLMGAMGRRILPQACGRETNSANPALAAPALELAIRPRRNRKAEWARRMVRENVVTTDDLITA